MARSWSTPTASRYGTFAEMTQQNPVPNPKNATGADVECANPQQAQSPDRQCNGGGLSV